MKHVYKVLIVKKLDVACMCKVWDEFESIFMTLLHFKIRLRNLDMQDFCMVDSKMRNVKSKSLNLYRPCKENRSNEKVHHRGFQVPFLEHVQYPF